MVKGLRPSKDISGRRPERSRIKGKKIVMETVMNGIEKHVEYYRAHLPHDRSAIPLTIALATIVALWLLIYLVCAVGPQPKWQPGQSAAHPSAVVSQTVSPRH